MQTIMIVEDDPVIREELAFLLRNENYLALPVTDFENIPKQVRSVCPDLVLLDLGLPECDGLSLCAAIRKAASVIVVTIRTSALDELQALNLGSDEPDILKAAGLQLSLTKGTVTAATVLSFPGIVLHGVSDLCCDRLYQYETECAARIAVSMDFTRISHRLHMDFTVLFYSGRIRREEIMIWAIRTVRWRK